MRKFINWSSITLAWLSLVLATATKGVSEACWTLACMCFTVAAILGIYFEHRKLRRPRGRISVPPDPRRNGHHPSHREKIKR